MKRQSKRDATAAYLTGRLIKIVANGLRPFFYCHYWLFPSQRFELKTNHLDLANYQHERSDKNIRPRNIPRIVWQTNYTNKVTLPVKVCWLCNRLLAANHGYIFHRTEDRLAFVEEHFPGRPSALYKRLSIGAAQADLWRLLVLYKYGGIYLDIDAHLVWPLERIIKPEINELFVRYKSLEATNYFLCSAPESDTIKAIIDEVLNRIENSKSNNVYDITGPSVVEHVLAKREHHWRLVQHTCLQGNFSNKFFQYLDKPNGCWTMEQQQRRVVNP